LKKHKIIILP